MRNLDETIEALISEFGAQAVVKATLKAKEKTDGSPHKCKEGQYWNGTECVDDVG